MLSKLIQLVACTLVASVAYPFVLASKVARESIEVTQEQLTELKGATFASDRIAYAIFGAVIASLLALTFAKAEPWTKRLPALGAGAVLGALAGFLSGMLAHWFLNNPTLYVQDTMVHIFLMVSVLMLPIAIAIGLSTGMVSKSATDIVGATIAASLGALGAALLYAVLNGTVTEQEQRHMIMPGHSFNRILLIALTVLSIGAALVIQQSATNKKSAQSKHAPPDSLGDVKS
jgi:uncharacterized membrane protein